MKTMNYKNLTYSSGLIRLCLIAVMLFTSWAGSQAQQEQRYWIFGQGTSPFNLEFNQGSVTTAWTSITPPALPATGPNAFGTEGTGVVTDPYTGKLQFFTDGNTVYQATYNGNNPPTFSLVNGQPGQGLGANSSSAQPVAISVFPECPFDRYYIFSNETGNVGVNHVPGKITYRLYNSSTQQFTPPLGSLATDLPLISGFKAEGMLIVPGPVHPVDGPTFWLITRRNNSTWWDIYGIDLNNGVYHNQSIREGALADGIGNLAYTPVSASNPNVGEIGCIYSPTNQNTIVTGVFRLQFDASIGEIVPGSWYGIRESGDFPSANTPYDVEWSPDGRYLYYSSYSTSSTVASRIWQHDVVAGNNLIPQGTFQTNFNGTELGIAFPQMTRSAGLKLGRDGVLYHIQNTGPTPGNPGPGMIGGILNPNSAQATYTGSLFPFTNTFTFNFPEFANTPEWYAEISIQGNTTGTICEGQDITITSTITMPSAVTSYQWYDATTNLPITGEVGQTLTTNLPGSYYLIVTFLNACPLKSNTVTVTPREDCCFAEFIGDYESITTDPQYSIYTVSPERVYVHPGVTITVDGTTLDLTNVDMVFGECAGINVINGGKIIANNSVFRPCDENESWDGISFDNNCVADINECTFINAASALLFSSLAGQSDADITNNLFKNCRISIAVLLSVFNQGITGNTFTVTNDLVEFAESGCITAGVQNNQHIGIYGLASSFEDLVSQNDFVDATIFPSTKEFQGVFMEGGMINLSQNTFTDMFRSIDFSNVSNSTIENNTVEMTRRLDDLQHQIRISESDAVYITGNQMTNSLNYHAYSGLRSAMYLENSTGLYVHKNEINGFESGITAFDINTCSIGENRLEDGAMFGIYIEEGFAIDLTCNSIRMRLDNNATGIQYLQTAPIDQGISIRNNCIFDTEIALYLQLPAQAEGDLMPAVTNNFFYNYGTGIYNDGFSGGIGTATPFAEAGRNTFSSNDAPQGALDIFSTVPILAVGNSGILNISANVTVLDKNLYSSSASCANYIFSEHNELTDAENCDHWYNQVEMIIVTEEGNGLAKEAFGRLINLAPANHLATATAILSILDHNGAPGEKEKMLRFLDENTDWLSPGERTRLDFRMAIRANDLSAARTALASAGASTPEMAPWTALARIVIRLHENGEGRGSLNQVDLQLLRAIDADGSFAAAQARDLVHAAIGGHDYRFRPTQVFKHDQSAEPGVSLTEDLIQLFPNPAENILNVRMVATDGSAVQLEIYDVTGKKFMDRNMDFNAGTISLDIAEFPSGLYIVKITTANGANLSQKFIRN